MQVKQCLRPESRNLIDTERLRILPLRVSEMMSYLNAGFVTDEDMDYVANVLIPQLVIFPGKYLFYTFWVGIERNTREFVTEFVFHGEPKGGVVEIGYQTKKGFEGNGFMTETVGGMVGWCRGRNEIRMLEANAENKASARILEKNNFIGYNNLWKLKV